MDSRFEVEEAQASFRGVSLGRVVKRVRDGGRRGPTHEAPGRDEADGEDLGRKVRAFKVDTVVFGDGSTDAARQADCNKKTRAIIAALEDKSGAGLYRDPWHGAWSVICRSFSVTDDDNRAFVAQISMSFEESGTTRYPLAAADTAFGVENSAAAVARAAVAAFDAIWRIKGRPQFVQSAGLSMARSVIGSLTGLSLVQLDASSALGISDKSSGLTALAASLESLAGAGGLGAGLAGGFRSVGASALNRRSGQGDANAVRTSFAGLAGWGADLGGVFLSTESRRVQAENQAAMVSLTRRLALTEEARALAARRWDSRDQAVAERDGLLSRLDSLAVQAGESGDDTVLSAMQILAVAVTADIAARAPETRVRKYQNNTVLPAAVLAYRLTGSGAKADDLVARNDIVNPLFVPAIDVEYLSDG